MSNYGLQLRPYFELFGRERVKILTFEEIITSTKEVMRDVFSWLGVNSTHDPVYSKGIVNATAEVIEQVRGKGLLNRFRYSNLWNAVGPNIPAIVRQHAKKFAVRNIDRRTQDRRHVIKYLRPIQQNETEALRELLDRSFPEWKTLYGTFAP